MQQLCNISLAYQPDNSLLMSRKHVTTYIKCKGQAIPLQAWTGSEGSRRLLCTGCLYPPSPKEILLVLISVKNLSQPQSHSAAGRIMSMKNSNDTIGYRTRGLPACSTVPEPTAPPRAPQKR